jgi:thymidylate synthase
VHDIPGETPKIWEQCSDKDGFINSNYGWTTFSKENYSQFDKVVEELSNNEFSRQGIIIFIRPTMHEDSKKNGMHDFICTYCYNFKIEVDTDGIEKLFMLVNMRSNDCVFGYDNDYAFADYVFDKMLTELQKTYLDLQKGCMFWKADNFHVYPRHFKYLEEE